MLRARLAQTDIALQSGAAMTLARVVLQTEIALEVIELNGHSVRQLLRSKEAPLLMGSVQSERLRSLSSLEFLLLRVKSRMVRLPLPMKST